jgi:prophage antirepressor-like protein
MNLIPLDYNGAEVRMVGTIDKFEWVAADVVAILYPEADPQSRNSYFRNVPEQWKGSAEIPAAMKNLSVSSDGVRKTQTMVTLLEPGLYSLIARSRSPIAVHFQKWLFEEVLPSIRRTGGYSVNPEPDRFAELRERVELAKSLAGNPGAIEAYKSLFHGVQEPKRSPGRPKKTPEPEPAPVAEVVENPILQPNAILTDFLVKLNDLAQRDIVTDCAFTKIMKAYKPYLAVHLPTVWLLMVEHFAMPYDRVSLENAIISCHGYRRTLQRFVPKTGGEKKTQQRHCALIPMKSIDATSTARMLLESTIEADTAIPSSATQNAPMTP